MENKNQILIDLDVIDELIIRLTKSKQLYEDELLDIGDIVDEDGYLEYAREYFRTTHMLNYLKEYRKEKQNI
jgi:hypothetical protein